MKKCIVEPVKSEKYIIRYADREAYFVNTREEVIDYLKKNKVDIFTYSSPKYNITITENDFDGFITGNVNVWAINIKEKDNE